MAEGAYSANTLRAQKADGAIFQAFCEWRGEPYLPADPKTIRAFIEHRSEGGQKARDREAIHRHNRASAHRRRVIESLFRAKPCGWDLKKMGRETSARQDAGAALGLEGDQGIY